MLAFVPRRWYHCENANTLIGAAILFSGHPLHIGSLPSLVPRLYNSLYFFSAVAEVRSRTGVVALNAKRSCSYEGKCPFFISRFPFLLFPISISSFLVLPVPENNPPCNKVYIRVFTWKYIATSSKQRRHSWLIISSSCWYHGYYIYIIVIWKRVWGMLLHVLKLNSLIGFIQ